MIHLLQPKREMSDNNEEKIFLSDPNGLQISNKRIVVESKTYALNLITTASGTEQVLCCGDDKDYALEIVEAINQAIVSK